MYRQCITWEEARWQEVIRTWVQLHKSERNLHWTRQPKPHLGVSVSSNYTSSIKYQWIAFFQARFRFHLNHRPRCDPSLTTIATPQLPRHLRTRRRIKTTLLLRVTASIQHTSSIRTLLQSARLRMASAILRKAVSSKYWAPPLLWMFLPLLVPTAWMSPVPVTHLTITTLATTKVC